MQFIIYVAGFGPTSVQRCPLWDTKLYCCISKHYQIRFWSVFLQTSDLIKWLLCRLLNTQHHYSSAGLSNLLHTCIFLHSWTFWFAHLDFYKNKPGPGPNPHKTAHKIWTIIGHSRFFAKTFAHLVKRLDTPGLEYSWVLKMRKVGGGEGGNRFEHWYYTPLYEKGIKKIENKSMKTTSITSM